MTGPPCRQVPRSYLSLQEAVLAEQQRRRLSDEVQYLTDRQLQQLVEQTPCNDIVDYEDLQSGGRTGGRGAGDPERGGWPSASEPVVRSARGRERCWGRPDGRPSVRSTGLRVGTVDGLLGRVCDPAPGERAAAEPLRPVA